MRESHDDVRRRLRDALADESGPAVVNLYGPLGIGKSRLAREVAECDVTVFDGVDRAEVAASALAAVSAAPGTRFLVVGRRPVRTWPGWSVMSVRTVRLGPWTAADVRRLARSFGVVDPARLDAVVDLAGGVPFVADVLCRAAGNTDSDSAAAAARGGLADAASRAVGDRLRTEVADPPTDTLHIVSALGGADADLLAAVGVPVAEFDRVSALSIVDTDDLGRTVAEPFRTVFDLAYRWRHPVAADAVLTKAASHRRRRIAATRDAATRAALSDRVMRTVAHPRIRQAFFPPSAATFQARPATATADDERDVIRLFRQWACVEGLERRRADRMLEAWMTVGTPGFHLLFDGEGRAVSLANLTPIGAGAGPVLEALLQQYTDEFALRPAAPPGGYGLGYGYGHLLGMMTAATRRPAARAAMLRHILHVSIPSGRVVVSTSWPPYRILAENLGLRTVGDTTDDLFGCGRRNRVLERTFSADSIGPWLRRMERADERPDPFVEAVRSALGCLRMPRALADSPLLGLPGLATTAALADFLRRAIDELAASELTTDAEAGRILLRYFVLRNTGHDALIHQAHLSRATYFRRLDHGVRLVAEAARQLLHPNRPDGY
ncbi:MAG: hypothetical protein HOW97_21570 [Catenulispora sp.]|nr:hypothetical protein [Catenulispora sp.]